MRPLAFLLSSLPAAAFAQAARRAVRLGKGAQLAALIAAGVVVLVAGLVVFGRDGRMLTYAALVLAQGSLAWWLRGSR